MAPLTPRPGIMDIAPYVGGQSKDTSYKGKLSSNEFGHWALPGGC